MLNSPDDTVNGPYEICKSIASVNIVNYHDVHSRGMTTICLQAVTKQMYKGIYL